MIFNQPTVIPQATGSLRASEQKQENGSRLVAALTRFTLWRNASMIYTCYTVSCGSPYWGRIFFRHLRPPARWIHSSCLQLLADMRWTNWKTPSGCQPRGYFSGCICKSCRATPPKSARHLQRHPWRRPSEVAGPWWMACRKSTQGEPVIGPLHLQRTNTIKMWVCPKIGAKIIDEWIFKIIILINNWFVCNNCHLGALLHTHMNITSLMTACDSEAKVPLEETCRSTPAWLHSCSWYVSTNTWSSRAADACQSELTTAQPNKNVQIRPGVLPVSCRCPSLQLCQSLFLWRHAPSFIHTFNEFIIWCAH